MNRTHTRLPSRTLAGTGLALGTTLLTGATAEAAILQVDNTTDTGGLNACTTAPADCSLRGAITNSNGTPSVTDMITFASSVTGSVTLNNAELDVTDGVHFSGPGAGTLAISGGNQSRIMDVNLASPGEEVRVQDLTLTAGGDIDFGGAIFNDNSELRVIDSVLSGNQATVHGGAIYEDLSTAAETVITNSTLTGNSADVHGGAIYSRNEIDLISATTISGNEAGQDGGGLRAGDQVTIQDSTIAGNTAGDEGGGFLAVSPSTVRNTIFADNSALAGPDAVGQLTAGFSLFESTVGATITHDPVGSNLTGLDPLLGPLQDNGGKTPTRRPALNSPVLDKGSANVTPDQRGVARPIDLPAIANATGGDGADIGAFELTLAETLPPPIGGPGQTPAGPAPVPAAPARKCKRGKKKPAAAAKKKRCKRKKRG